MRKKLLFLALVLAATWMSTSSPRALALTCPPGQHVLVCGEDVFCCSAVSWPRCICP